MIPLTQLRKSVFYRYIPNEGRAEGEAKIAAEFRKRLVKYIK
jgi:hypothetical protein